MTYIQEQLIFMNNFFYMKFKNSFKHNFLGALVFLLMLPLIGFSQDSDLGNWMIYIGNKKLNIA